MINCALIRAILNVGFHNPHSAFDLAIRKGKLIKLQFFPYLFFVVVWFWLLFVLATPIWVVLLVLESKSMGIPRKALTILCKQKMKLIIITTQWLYYYCERFVFVQYFTKGNFMMIIQFLAIINNGSDSQLTHSHRVIMLHSHRFIPVHLFKSKCDKRWIIIFSVCHANSTGSIRFAELTDLNLIRIPEWWMILDNTQIVKCIYFVSFALHGIFRCNSMVWVMRHRNSQCSSLTE